MLVFFQGCYYHGHQCQDKFSQPKTDRTYFGSVESLQMKFAATQAKLKRLNELGYNVKSIWECEFNSFLIENPIIDDILNDDPRLLFNQLNPREAIYGGRTEVFKLHYKPKQGEKIRYIDFCSLYPYVNWKGVYPVGHPEKILIGQKECDTVDLEKCDGLIKCRILPPQQLKIPVLPAKINKKLIFTLCRTCAEQQNIYDCLHNDEERAIIGTWVLCEVKTSLKYGYTILDKIEIWSYKTERYNPETKTGGLFTDYMKTFLKIKQEASGWPLNCNTQEEKDAYIKMYEKTQDIKLYASKIEVNPSYRSLAKLCANSLWGKLCQKEENTKTSVLSNPNEFYQMLISPAIIINDIYTSGSENIYVSWKYTNDEDKNASKNVCIPAGAYTTTNARLMLFNELIQIQNEILYCDTDSLIYVEKEDSTYKPNIGPVVGQLTDEIAVYGEDAYISEFVCVGPKSYALKINVPSENKEIELCKCKGFCLNKRNAAILHFNSYKNLIFGTNENSNDTDNDDDDITTDKISTFSTKIKRNKGFILTTSLEEKQFQFTFSKRVCVNETGDTLPYGYKNVE